jgi:hypothetical protein
LIICQFSEPALGRVPGNPAKTALQIVNKNAVLLDSVSQLLVVFNEISGQNSAVLGA